MSQGNNNSNPTFDAGTNSSGDDGKSGKTFFIVISSVIALIVIFLGGYYLYVNYVGGLFARGATLPPYLLLTLGVIGGAASFFSPCNIAITPSLLAYFAGKYFQPQQILNDGDEKSVATVRESGRALTASTLIAFGILTFYALAGLLVSWIGALVYNYLIYLIPAVGVAFVVLGYLILSGRSFLGFSGFERVNPANRYYKRLIASKEGIQLRGNVSLYAFGLSYGAASHTCTLPIFLGIVLIPLATGAYWLAGATVLLYGVAMATLFVLMLILGRSAIAGLYRRMLTKYLKLATGGLFIITGAYLIFYFIQNFGGLL